MSTEPNLDSNFSESSHPSAAVAIIQDFVNLQDELISVFRQKYSTLTDETYLLDYPHSGYFQARKEEWKFQQHGV